jgi:S-adenosyl methyltransferase
VTGTTTSPSGIDTTVPTTARMYDYWLGGHDNFAADRKAALEVSEVAPEAPLMARENRKFLRRAVRYLAAEAGISQFLDIGTGLPTAGNVHQVAQEINRDSRVVYVDNDRCKSGCLHGQANRVCLIPSRVRACAPTRWGHTCGMRRDDETSGPCHLHPAARRWLPCSPDGSRKSAENCGLSAEIVANPYANRLVHMKVCQICRREELNSS